MAARDISHAADAATPKSAATFLEEAARYFESRPTGGEDSAHWANVYNAANCRTIAARIADLEDAIAPLVIRCETSVFPDDANSSGITVRVEHLRRLAALHPSYRPSGTGTE